MTTTTCNLPCTSTSKRPNNFLPLLFCCLVFAIAVQLTLHAYSKRTNESEAVDQACGKSPLGLWENSSNGKFYQLCQMPDGSFGIRVLVKDTKDTFRKVTGFIRKMHGKPVLQLEEVTKYITEGNGATNFLGTP